MNPIYIVLITIVVTIAIYEVIKRLFRFLRYQFNRILALETQRDFNRTRFNSIRTDIANFNNIYKEYPAIKERLIKVETLASNFERDMDKYNNAINDDLAMLNKRIDATQNTAKQQIGHLIEKNDKFQKGLANAFKRIAKLEKTLEVHHVSLKGLDEVQLIHARSISKLRKEGK